MEIATADGDVRYVPREGGETANFGSSAHESRYRWLADNFAVKGKKILDFGCGSGYGAGFLSSLGGDVLGIDISGTSIDYARKRYPAARFLHTDLADPALPSAVEERFDLVVSFDVIEHVEKYWAFVQNSRAMLKEGGVAVIGCPNRLATFDFNTGWNLYHKQEFTPMQLDWLLGLSYPSVQLYGQDFASQEYKRRFITGVRNAQAKRKFPANLAHYVRRKINKLKLKRPLDPRDLEMCFTRLDLERPDTHAVPYGLIAVCGK